MREQACVRASDQKRDRCKKIGAVALCHKQHDFRICCRRHSDLPGVAHVGRVVHGGAAAVPAHAVAALRHKELLWDEM